GFAALRADGFDPAAVVARTTVALEGREAAVRNHATNLTDLVADAMRHEAKTDLAVFSGGSIRIDDELPPRPITQYDVIRILPFGGPVVRADFTGALLTRTLQIGEQNRGSGGFLQSAGITRDTDGFKIDGRPIDPSGRYAVAMSDFLMTGGEANL